MIKTVYVEAVANRKDEDNNHAQTSIDQTIAAGSTPEDGKESHIFEDTDSNVDHTFKYCNESTYHREISKEYTESYGLYTDGIYAKLSAYTKHDDEPPKDSDKSYTDIDLKAYYDKYIQHSDSFNLNQNILSKIPSLESLDMNSFPVLNKEIEKGPDIKLYLNNKQDYLKDYVNDFLDSFYAGNGHNLDEFMVYGDKMRENIASK